jgi:hypothetical protein
MFAEISLEQHRRLPGITSSQGHTPRHITTQTSTYRIPPTGRLTVNQPPELGKWTQYGKFVPVVPLRVAVGRRGMALNGAALDPDQRREEGSGALVTPPSSSESSDQRWDVSDPNEPIGTVSNEPAEGTTTGKRRLLPLVSLVLVCAVIGVGMWQLVVLHNEVSSLQTQDRSQLARIQSLESSPVDAPTKLDFFQLQSKVFREARPPRRCPAL